MKKFVKILAIIFGILILLLIAGISFLKLALPNVGEPELLTINGSDEQIEHGKYLANNVMVCMDCHSERDWTKFSGPVIEGTLGKGGEIFNEDMGFPGSFISKNITPYALSSWTDGEIFRAITTGVSKDGNALFPIMPYTHYGKVDRNDIEAVIAYLKTLPSIESEIKESEANFPMNLIINTMPEKPQFITKPKVNDRIQYGAYLVNSAACYDCHTKQEKGKFTGEDFAGGMEFRFKDGSIVRAPNITPSQSGIGSWTKDQFIERFKFYADSIYVPPLVESGSFQTVMPWTMYSGMKEEDLGAIFAYLKTLKPVENTVERFSTASVN